MNKYVEEIESNSKCILYANYASQEVIRANPDKVEENAIVIICTKDNAYWIGYENKECELLPLDPKTISVRKSILNKKSEYFRLEEGDYYGTYVVSKFISNDETCATVQDFLRYCHS